MKAISIQQYAGVSLVLAITVTELTAAAT